MRLKEQRLWDRMRNNMPNKVFLERVENMLPPGGFPDVVALVSTSLTRAVFMIELKAIEVLPKRATTPLLGGDGLSQDQRNWLLRWRHAGGDAYIVISAGVGAKADHFAVGCEHHDAVNGWSLDELHRCARVSGRSRAFWNALAEDMARRH